MPDIDLTLAVLPDRLAVCRLPTGLTIPEWAHSGPFSSVTVTPQETSIVCAQDAVPAGFKREDGWRALAVQGKLAFGLTGILATIAVPLAEAGIPIFSVSTYDTDYVLVKEERLGDAIAALTAVGLEIVT